MSDNLNMSTLTQLAERCRGAPRPASSLRRAFTRTGYALSRRVEALVGAQRD